MPDYRQAPGCLTDGLIDRHCLNPDKAIDTRILFMSADELIAWREQEKAFNEAREAKDLAEVARRFPKEDITLTGNQNTKSPIPTPSSKFEP